MHKLGKAIQSLRTLRGMTQETLAERLNTTQSRVSYLESGRHSLTLSTLANVADALEVELVIKFKVRIKNEDSQ